MRVTDVQDTLERSLHWRYATKKFDAEKQLNDELLQSLLESVRMAPSSYGLQPFHLTVIKDKILREKINSSGASAQSQILDSQCLIVFSIDKDLDESDVDTYIGRIAGQRSTDKQKLEPFSATIKSTIASKSPEQRHDWAARQAYLALGFLLQSAAILEVDACPMEGFNRAKLEAVLPNHTNKLPVVIVALGYRDENDRYASLPKVRKSREELITFI
jgi:nitroreductase